MNTCLHTCIRAYLCTYTYKCLHTYVHYIHKYIHTVSNDFRILIIYFLNKIVYRYLSDYREVASINTLLASLGSIQSTDNVPSLETPRPLTSSDSLLSAVDDLSDYNSVASDSGSVVTEGNYETSGFLIFVCVCSSCYDQNYLREQ